MANLPDILILMRVAAVPGGHVPKRSAPNGQSKMKIVVRQTGGYAGVTEVADLDTSELESGRAEEIERLVDEALAAAPQAEAVGADLMQYEVTIRNDGESRVLRFVDDGTSDGGPLKRLVEKLVG